jgi:hypothetical protein
MADKVRRTKDLITRTVDRFKDTTMKDYAKYFEGSPTYVTYYQLDMEATKQDTNLENVNNLVGSNSPNKYKKITDVVIYGIDALGISNEISEKGLQSLITGDFVLLPDSIRPYPGDFFTFDDTELTDHLFRVNDVQYDKASPRKFFRCAFALYQDQPELILGNVSEDYVLNYNNVGGEETAVLKKETAVMGEKATLLVNGLIDKFTNLFYDEDMDNFLCPLADYVTGQMFYFWSPYAQKFIHDHKILDKFERDFMNELYVNDINEALSRNIFSDFAYYNSIYRKLETMEPFSFENSFMVFDELTDLKKTRKLPFFHGTQTYRTIQVVNSTINSYHNLAKGFHILYQNYNQTIATYSQQYRFPNDHEVVNSDIAGFQDGQIFYVGDPVQQEIYRMFGSTPKSIGFNDSGELENEVLYNTIKRYLITNKSDPRYLIITEELLLQINNLFLTANLKNYILLPMVIYVLKERSKNP